MARAFLLLLGIFLAVSAQPAWAADQTSASSLGGRLLQGGKTVLKHIVAGPEPLPPDEGKLTVTETILAVIPTNVPLTELLISPDQRRVAYIDKRADGVMVVVNEQAGPPCDEIGSLTFSPDSKRLAYRVAPADYVVVDGQPSRFYGQVMHGTPVFSPDSAHVAYWATPVPRRWRVFVDASYSKEYDNHLWNSKLVFDGPSQLRALAVRDRTVVLLEMRIGGS